MNPKTLRIVFMGTPEFAVPSLRRLVAEGYNVVGAVTVPDKPAGRGRHLRESDVKIAARELGVPVLQPEKFRDPAFLDALQALQPDLGIVIAFKMLPEVVWAMPRLGTFNLHASLLPEYRGAAPINWAIINGERETGITTFLLNHEIDKGAILAQERVAIAPEDNVGTLYERLMLLGAELVTATVDRIAAGDCTPAEQMHFDESRLHPAPKIFKEDCRIDWRQPGERIVNLVRGLSPYPTAWTPIFKKGEPSDTAKIFAVHFEPGGVVQRPGTVETDKRTYLAVACADGRLTPAAVTVYGPYRRNTDHGTDRRLREAQQSVGQWRQVGGTFRDDQYDDKRDRSHFAVVRHLEHHANHLFQYDGDDHSCRRKAEIHQIDIGHDRTDEGAQHPQPPLLNGVADIGLLLHDDRRDTGQHRPRQARRFMEMRRNRKT